MNPSTNCPFCSSKGVGTTYDCGTSIKTLNRSRYCREREARQKAEAQNRRLHEEVQELNENAENITTYADQLWKSQYENQRLRELLEISNQYLDHKLECEKTNGSSLPCTCGLKELREALNQLTK